MIQQGLYGFDHQFQTAGHHDRLSGIHIRASDNLQLFHLGLKFGVLGLRKIDDLGVIAEDHVIQLAVELELQGSMSNASN